MFLQNVSISRAGPGKCQLMGKRHVRGKAVAEALAWKSTNAAWGADEPLFLLLSGRAEHCDSYAVVTPTSALCWSYALALLVLPCCVGPPLPSLCFSLPRRFIGESSPEKRGRNIHDPFNTTRKIIIITAARTTTTTTTNNRGRHQPSQLQTKRNRSRPPRWSSILTISRPPRWACIWPSSCSFSWRGFLRSPSSDQARTLMAGQDGILLWYVLSLSLLP